MKEKGVGIDDLAERVKRSPTTVSRWRNGRKEPSFEDMDKIARALGVHVQALFDDPTEPPQAKAMRLVRRALDEMES